MLASHATDQFNSVPAFPTAYIPPLRVTQDHHITSLVRYLNTLKPNMHVFVTGASGLVGKALIPQLVAANHTVSALARSDSSAAAVQKLGATNIVKGSTDDLDILAEASRKVDAVIHLAFDHDLAFRENKYAEACEKDRVAIKAICDALAESGTNKTFLSTSGLISILGSDEKSGRDPNPALPRTPNEDLALSYSQKGLRTLLVCLPHIVHGPGAEHPFVSAQIAVAKNVGYVGFIEGSTALWQSVHAKDAAKMYVLGLQHGPAGSLLFPIHEEAVPTKDIAAVIAKKLNLPLQSVKAEDAGALWGTIGFMLQTGHKISPKYSKQWTGWEATEYGLFEELENYPY